METDLNDIIKKLNELEEQLSQAKLKFYHVDDMLFEIRHIKLIIKKEMKLK